jgi:DNA-directed RNA polymerase specialized sigma subunit, sigma24 homolog
MNTVIAEHRGRVEALAVRLAKPGTRGRNGVEFEDLVQEGLIDVWQSLSRGIRPSDQNIRRRMLDYIKWMGRHAPTDYGTMLPLDDYTSVPEPREEDEDAAQPDRLLREVSGD